MHIKYQEIPDEIITDFKNNIDKSFTLTIQHDKGDICNFDGGPSDIIIYIEENITGLLISGILLNAIYDGLKFAIKSLWKNLVKHYSKQKTIFEKDKNSIEINFVINPDKSIIFKLNGNIDEKLIDKITENLFESLKDIRKYENNFTNLDFKANNENNLKITMIFNTVTNTWEPLNYSDINKKMDDLYGKAFEDSEN